jgi:hypothetical protein
MHVSTQMYNNYLKAGLILYSHYNPGANATPHTRFVIPEDRVEEAPVSGAVMSLAGRRFRRSPTNGFALSVTRTPLSTP